MPARNRDNLFKPAAELAAEADAARLAAEDRDWEKPSPDTAKMVDFWTEMRNKYAGLPAGELVPLF